MNDRVIRILLDSFFKILIPGLQYTIPLTIITFAIGLLIAIAVAIVRVYKIKVIDQIVRFYVWVFRGTPLLVQLFIIFYGFFININIFIAFFYKGLSIVISIS